MLAELDPSGRAGGYHGQLAAVLNTTDKLVGFLDYGEVGGEVHVVYTFKAERFESGDHLALAVGARLISEALADLRTN